MVAYPATGRLTSCQADSYNIMEGALFQLSSHLWPPQRRGLEETIAMLQAGKDLCLYGPTGSGKTTQASELARWATYNGIGTCFYVNRKLLVGQTLERFRSAGLDVAVRAADYEDEFNQSAMVQICSADTERSRVMGERQQWDFHDAGLVITDEAHMQKAETMKKIVDFHRENGARIVLLTATPIGISHMVENLVVSGTMQEYRDCKALVPATVRSIEQPDMSKVKRNETGEFIMDGRKKKIYTQTIIANVIDRWKRYNPDARQAMAYWPGVAESVWGTKQFTDIGVPFAHVDATDAVLPEWRTVEGVRTLVTRRVKLTRSLWQEILARFKAGEIVGLSSRFKLREGVDVPFVYHCILATPIGSMVSFVQTVGRVLRHSAETPTGVLVTDHGGCLDHKTEILTSRGWVGVGGVSLADSVAGYDVKSGEISWQPVNSTHARPLEPHEKMFEVSSRCADIRVTGNHRLIVARRGWRDRRPSWDVPSAFERADQASLRAGRFKIPVSGWQPAPGVSLSDDELRFIGWFLAGKRGTSKSRRRRLGAFLDKNLSPLLEDMDERQFDVFLHAILGDGDKSRRPGSYRISTGLKTFADRLQSLCVRRGYKCNISAHSKKRKSTLYVLNVKKTDFTTVHGDKSGSSGQSRLVESHTDPMETVWCVSNPLGTLVIRRNGKVAIVGNSYWRHGSPNADRPWHEWFTMKEAHISQIRERGIKDHGEKEPIRCPQCEGERLGGMTCPHCGFTHPKSQRCVIQVDGSMKVVDGPLLKPTVVRRKPDTEDKWTRMFWGYRKKHVNATFAQMEAFFTHENQYHPPRNIPFMPKDKHTWCRVVYKVPFSDLILPSNWTDTMK